MRELHSIADPQAINRGDLREGRWELSRLEQGERREGLGKGRSSRKEGRRAGWSGCVQPCQGKGGHICLES